MKTNHSILLLFAVPMLAFAQTPCRIAHLTIFDANLAEFLEERSLDLQAGDFQERKLLLHQALKGSLFVLVDQGDGKGLFGDIAQL